MLCRVALVRTDAWEAQVPPKRRFLQEPRGVTSQKTPFLSVVPSSLILVTLMKEALHSTDTSVRTKATRHNIPENAILHSHRHENLKFYVAFTDCKKDFAIMKKNYLPVHPG
jgi:hypothetical protein